MPEWTALADNITRYGPHATTGHYESYFWRANDPESRRAIWLNHDSGTRMIGWWSMSGVAPSMVIVEQCGATESSPWRVRIGGTPCSSRSRAALIWTRRLEVVRRPIKRTRLVYLGSDLDAGGRAAHR